MSILPLSLIDHKKMVLRARLGFFTELARHCRLCPRHCGVNRLEGELGACGAARLPKIAVALPHYGEEPPLVGSCGSGTVFFSHCPLRCCFCQNYDISHHGLGREIQPFELAHIFLDLQQMGCHNLNLVSPSQSLHMIVEALLMAYEKGFRLPVVYNSSGYESIETLELLDGVIDIYLPDAKYGEGASSKELSAVSDYAWVNRLAIREMYRQTGPVCFDAEDHALRGLIIRHLVLPFNLAHSRDVLRMIAEETGGQASVSLMGQYFPVPQVASHPQLYRVINESEWLDALKWLTMFDLERGWLQRAQETTTSPFVPDFHVPQVFTFIKQHGLERCTIH